MTTSKKDKQYAIMAYGMLLSLIVGSLVVNFNLLDLGYLIVLVFYIIRYFYIKE